MQWMYVLVVLLLASPSYAAYLNPEIEKTELQANGLAKLTLVFRGDAGERDVRAELLIRPGMTYAHGRYWVDDKLNELDAAYTAASAAQLQPGQTIPRLARPAPTDKEVWRKRFAMYLAAKDSGITAMSADLAAEKTWLEANYQAGFFSE